MYGVMQVVFLIEAVLIFAGISMSIGGNNMKDIIVGIIVTVMSFITLILTIVMFFARNLSRVGMTRWHIDGTRDTMDMYNLGDGAANSYFRYENYRQLPNSSNAIQTYYGGKDEF